MKKSNLIRSNLVTFIRKRALKINGRYILFVMLPLLYLLPLNTYASITSVIHVEDFSDWSKWKSDNSATSNYSPSGETVAVTGDGCNGDVWHQFTNTYNDSIGVSGILNISSISGCAQIGFRQMFFAENDATYHYHFNVCSCGYNKINIFVQKLDSNGNQLSREDFYFDCNVINEDLKLWVYPDFSTRF